MRIRAVLAALLVFGAGQGAMAEAQRSTVLVAVAANFLPVLEVLEPLFEADARYDLQIAAGSTGQLYAQIASGAPFDVFLAADQARPALLEAEGHALPGSRVTYAQGRLALWSRDPARVDAEAAAALRSGDVAHIAIANPALAPYGAAALQALSALGVEAEVQGKIVRGQNVGQAFSLVATGNAQLGLVALSQVLGLPEGARGSHLALSPSLHDPIRQDLVALTDHPGTWAFLEFLASDGAHRVIADMGYSVTEAGL